MKLNVDKLEEIRRSMGLGVHDFARAIGVSHQKYYDILRSKDDLNAKMYMGTPTKIAKRLHIPIKSILIFDDDE